MATVLVIGDTHCPGMRRGYVDFLQQIADKHGIDRVVHIGDLVDWAAISYHEKLPGLPGAKDEVRTARRQVAQLAKAFPKADWLIGNHDSLPERQAATAGLPGELLRSQADFWQVEWNVLPRFTKYIIDGVIYSHGDAGKGGMMAALKQAKDNFQSTVVGHFHAQAGVQWYANPEHRIFGLSAGCGIDAAKLAFSYGAKFPSKPILGCGVVVNGKQAIFEPWLLKSK
jgi:predicted phosphodiesterase